MKADSLKKILIVDDEPIITEELSEYFADHGYQCLCCHEHDTAISMYRKHKDISIVLSDFHMPGKDGLVLLKSLLEMSRHSARPLKTILFTGQSEKEDIINALRCGISDYHAKPLDMEELLTSVEKLNSELSQESGSQQIEQITAKLNHLSKCMDELREDISQLNNNDNPIPDKNQAHENEQASELLEKLSPRQQAVARLIGKGMTNYQIAVALGLSENTIKLYVSQILRLTNMKNRTQIALTLANQ
ncbi:response regulator transcription factor [Oceanimonas doudoroffii]|uniref:DNA-binding response regulator n=1 Tax=Oceanimonas doudoroffii TaxID=84158 RepID=A0A233RBV9_9GAMM|nr:response regulator transcription factor [Oceanimonas doudoroffii]OXY80878.1 hypothetical protein B6S08_15755 [Oceanimonas doudoroffii]